MMMMSLRKRKKARKLYSLTEDTAFLFIVNGNEIYDRFPVHYKTEEAITEAKKVYLGTYDFKKQHFPLDMYDFCINIKIEYVESEKYRHDSTRMGYCHAHLAHQICFRSMNWESAYPHSDKEILPLPESFAEKLKKKPEEATIGLVAHFASDDKLTTENLTLKWNPCHYELENVSHDKNHGEMTLLDLFVSIDGKVFQLDSKRKTSRFKLISYDRKKAKQKFLSDITRKEPEDDSDD